MSGCMRRIGGLPRSARHFPISWSTRRKSVLVSMRSFFRDGLGLEKIDREFSACSRWRSVVVSRDAGLLRSGLQGGGSEITAAAGDR